MQCEINILKIVLPLAFFVVDSRNLQHAGNQMFSHVNPNETSTDMITNYNVSEVTSTTLDQSSEVTLTSVVLSSEEISTYVVHSSEDTSTTIVQSSELSLKYPNEVSSSIPFQHYSHSPASIDKATASSTGNDICFFYWFNYDIFFKFYVLLNIRKNLMSINMEIWKLICIFNT